MTHICHVGNVVYWPAASNLVWQPGRVVETNVFADCTMAEFSRPRAHHDKCGTKKSAVAIPNKSAL